MSNKEMQRKRVKKDFINACNQIIKKDGIENISLRKVAKIAGYNSATMYNYFESLDHLIFFGAMKYLNKYTRSLNIHLKDEDNAMDIFLKVWKHFCSYAYRESKIYDAIFFADLNKNIGHYMKEYYDFFPEELIDNNITIKKMLVQSSIDERSMILLIDCAKEGYIESKDLSNLNDMILLIFEGIFNRVLNKSMTYELSMKKTMEYFETIIKSYLIKDYNFNGAVS